MSEAIVKKRNFWSSFLVFMITMASIVVAFEGFLDEWVLNDSLPEFIKILFIFVNKNTLIISFCISFFISILHYKMGGNKDSLINKIQYALTFIMFAIILGLSPYLILSDEVASETEIILNQLPPGLNETQRNEVVSIYQELNSTSNISFSDFATYLLDTYGIELGETIFCEISPDFNSISIREYPNIDANVLDYLYRGELQYAYAHNNGILNVTLWWAVELEIDNVIYTGWIHSSVVNENTLGCARIESIRNVE